MKSLDLMVKADFLMQRYGRLMRLAPATLFSVSVLALLSACGGGGGGGGGTTTPPPSPPVSGPAWYGFGRDAQHSDLQLTVAAGGVAAKTLTQIVWETSVDKSPPTNAPIHYGSPVITSKNTVLVPVKTTATGNFQVEGRAGASGSVMWTAVSDYIFPPEQPIFVFNSEITWIPSWGPTLTQANRMYMPGSGGKLLYLDNPDSSTGVVQSLVFYGANVYANASAAFDSSVFINTPLTVDASGNVFFGFTVNGSNPAGLTSGFARIGADGTSSWVAANTALSQTAAMTPRMNAAPGLSPDGTTVYVAVRSEPTSGNGVGYLVALDSTTLATKGSVQLNDPLSGVPAVVEDDSSASPVIGPDGDVYFGVEESTLGAHNYRGWLLHFDSTLSVKKTPGSFGWDDTPSIVPASLVTSYTGKSSYLIMSKYNNYAGLGKGDGKNKMAVLDPNATEADPVSGNPVMNEVLTVLGPTLDTANDASFPGAVKEWCVNSAAVDPNTHSVLMNSEDGFLYRWDLTTGLLTQKIWLDNGYGQAYTPTAIGPDGTVYSINNASLFAVGQ